MTTKELFNTWMELPGRLEALSYNSLQEGFEKTIERFNVLPELLNRADVGEVALEYYLDLDPMAIMTKSTEIDIGSFITDFGFVEFFLSQPMVLKKLPKTQLDSLYKKINHNLNTKLNIEGMPPDFFWLNTELILTGRLLKSENEDNFLVRMSVNKNIEKSLQQGEILSKEVSQDLYDSILELNYSK